MEGSTTRSRSPERTVKAHECATTRLCKKCLIEKPLSDFRAGRYKCKQCILEERRERYRLDPEYRKRQLAHSKNGYAKHRDNRLAQKSEYGKRPEIADREKARRRKRYNEDQEYKKKTNARQRRYYKDNKSANAAKRAKRRALEHSACPEWADQQKIAEMYKEARKLTRETGVVYSVDHIIPLKGKAVCGLHVETNLQVIPLSENIRKSNRVEDIV
jgi:hypothetical protein